MFTYEHHTERPLTLPQFAQRMVGNFAVIQVFIGVSLMIGVIGYRLTEHMAWIDALLNACMILGGMGPIGELHTTAGKLFASVYALYSGLFLIAITGILLAPVFHRVLHKFHEEKLEK